MSPRATRERRHRYYARGQEERDARPEVLERQRRADRPHDRHHTAQGLLSAHLHAVLVPIGPVTHQGRARRE